MAMTNTNFAAVEPSSEDQSSVLLPPGTRAPNFTLAVTPDQSLTLAELIGRPVVLAFYPADWSPVCGDQMAPYNEVLPTFRDFGAQLLGISVDGVWCHAAFTQSRNLEFPLLADFEPKGGVAKTYRSYRQQDGFAERSLYVIDKTGVIAWNCLSPVAVNPGADGILAALDRLES
jgi:peroxiredoxin